MSPQREIDASRHREFSSCCLRSTSYYSRQWMTQNMLATATRKVVSKACDACRRRKIKCNGLQPCMGCRSANLACTFDAPRGQGGNRGPRATVLNELRAKPIDQDTLSADLPSSNSTLEHTAQRTISTEPIKYDVLDKCMDAYMIYVYPVVPLLDMAVIKMQASQANSSPMSHQFIQAFCAYVSNFGHISDGGGNESPRTFTEESGRNLLESAMSSRPTRPATQPTSIHVYISFFLYGAWAGQGDYQQAWYYLREATTLFLMLRSKFNDWYDEKTQIYLFWVLVISER
jgi:SP family general alpha glucoside:H+ symporter-like MFS transporter